MVTLDLQQIFVAGKDQKRINEAHQSLQQGTPFAHCYGTLSRPATQ